MSEKIIICGASGHGKVIADILEKSEKTVLGFVDDDEKKWGENFFEYKIFGDIDELSNFDKSEVFIIIAVGDNYIRERIAEKISESGIRFGKAIHPSATIGKDVIIDAGSVVMANVVINPGTKIGKHCIINTSSSVDHDCLIEDYVHISPGVCCGGKVHVGRSSWVGLGATVINSIEIGKDSIVGAGATVINNVDDDSVVVGNPAKFLKPAKG